MQHLVVLEAVHQRRWRAAGLGGEKHRRAGHRFGWPCRQALDQLRKRHFGEPCLFRQQAGALPPCPHEEQDGGAECERHPAPFHELERIGAEEDRVNQQQRHHDEQRQPQRPAPVFPDHGDGHRGGHHHGACHRDAIGGGERARRLEEDDENDDARQQQPVDLRQVGLARMRLGGEADFHARQQAQLDRLLGQRKGAGDHRLGCDDGCRGRQHHHGDQRPIRHHAEEGIVDGRRVGDQQCPLAQIVESQRRQHHGEPGRLDGPLAEMPEVGIKRLRPRHREEDGPQRHQSDEPVVHQKVHRIVRVEAHQHAGMVEDVVEARRCEAQEPDKRDRAEEGRHPGRSL